MKMHEIFGHSFNFEIINKNTFRSCTCRYFGKIKAYIYKEEYGLIAVIISENAC